jgi:hypothetical protein
MIKAIETEYKDCVFRSRIEARWAVFFDALGIAWEYEPEGFDLGEAGWYLPDFWLPEWSCFIEIKPTWQEVGNVWSKLNAISQMTPILALYDLHSLNTDAHPNGILFLDNPHAKEAYKFVLWWGYANRVIGFMRDHAPREQPRHYYLWNGSNDILRMKDVDFTNLPSFLMTNKRITTAFKAARSARFEHGEHGTR